MNVFESPIDGRYFEDYVPGASYEFGSIRLEEAEILEFARRYDPQTMHTDPGAAAQGEFRGLIASGWQTAGIMMRLYCDHYLSRNASIVSPGVDELRWTLPVRPGDALHVRVTVLEAKRSVSKPDRGLVRAFVEVLNHRNEVVMTMKAMNLLKCRAAASEGA